MEAMEQLHEYLDGELDEVSHEEVARHFSICQRCYPHLRLEERFRDLLHGSQDAEACPEHVRRQVLELLAAEAEKKA
jgi:anti-sigma factor (TIGR02949 family)